MTAKVAEITIRTDIPDGDRDLLLLGGDAVGNDNHDRGPDQANAGGDDHEVDRLLIDDRAEGMTRCVCPPQ